MPQFSAHEQCIHAADRVQKPGGGRSAKSFAARLTEHVGGLDGNFAWHAGMGESDGNRGFEPPRPLRSSVLFAWCPTTPFPLARPAPNAPELCTAARTQACFRSIQVTLTCHLNRSQVCMYFGCGLGGASVWAHQHRSSGNFKSDCQALLMQV